METQTNDLTVGKVAALASVTVRALHHYDRIGLLKPGGRTSAGYRTYTDADLSRLRQILLYRELGFSLEEVASILDEGDGLLHLRRQRELLDQRLERLKRVIKSVEKEIGAREMGIELTPEERFEVWGDFDPAEHAGEVESRWGETEAYKESNRRTRSYSKQDWIQCKEESEQVTTGLIAAMQAGEPADGIVAMDLAEAHRLHIDRWFYPLGYEMHVGLADMYLADLRFTATYEEMATGLAGYIAAAIRANAARAR